MTKTKFDFNDVLTEFDTDDDFGFSSISEEDYTKAIVETEKTTEHYKENLKKVEKLILPFLTKLLKTADQAYIHWPNRAPQIESQIKKILELTRE